MTTEIHHTAYIPDEIADLTFAVQHNPNSPSRWLIRLPNPRTGLIDLKPYCRFGIDPSEVTSDVIGFGRTLEEAAANALLEAEAQKNAVSAAVTNSMSSSLWLDQGGATKLPLAIIAAIHKK